MDFNSATTWWVIAGLAVAAELASGTFYLLMLAIGLIAGAVAAHLGLSGTGQIVCAALVGGTTTGLWYLKRAQAPKAPPVSENADVNIDIGETLHVATWGPDRTARVPYRGSTWTVRLAPGAAATTGLYKVSAVEGNWLVVSPQA